MFKKIKMFFGLLKLGKAYKKALKEEKMGESKKWYASKTLIAGVATFVAGALTQLSPDTMKWLTSHSGAALEVLGSLIVFLRLLTDKPVEK